MFHEMCGLGLLVDGGHQVGRPEGEQDEDERGDCAPGDPTSALPEAEMEDEQGEVGAPDDNGPEDLGVPEGERLVAGAQRVSADGEADGEEDESGDEEAADELPRIRR